MKHTTGYADEMYAREDVAFPSFWDGEGYALDPVRKTDSTMHAAGGLGTSAHDLGQYLRLLLNGGAVDGEEILSMEAMEEMLALHSTSGRRDSAYRQLEGFGLGWMLGEFQGTKLAQHGGGYSGCAALISFLPELGIGVGVLANASGTGHQLCGLVTDDVHARFTGNELLAWRSEARRNLARVEQAAQARYGGTNPTAVEGGLSLAPEAYEGRYSNELWGTFIVTPEPTGLVLRLGNLRPAIDSTGQDTFRLTGGLKEAGHFVIESGRVVALVAELALGDTPVRFDRQ